jgi:hypothetical protein
MYNENIHMEVVFSGSLGAQRRFSTCLGDMGTSSVQQILAGLRRSLTCRPLYFSLAAFIPYVELLLNAARRCHGKSLSDFQTMHALALQHLSLVCHA